MLTMSDIAKKAGVSRSTASFVLNNREVEHRISPETRQRVLDAARELGYRPNALARAVGSGRNPVLALVKTGPSEQESRILEGVLKATAEAGYLLKVLSAADAHTYRAIAKHCIEQRLAGVVCRTFLREEATVAFRDELDRYGIPVVFVDDDLADLGMRGARSVTSDDEQGYRMLVEHLAALGHQDIVFIAGDSIRPQSLLRKKTFERAMCERGLDVPAGSVLDSDWDLGRTEQLTRKLFQNAGQRPTALICDGDVLAAVAIRTLSRLGLRVPADVSVVGYGGFSFSSIINPALTTVSQPFEEMGSVATRILLQDLQGQTGEPDLPAKTLLPTDLILGDSTTSPTPRR